MDIDDLARTIESAILDGTSPPINIPLGDVNLSFTVDPALVVASDNILNTATNIATVMVNATTSDDLLLMASTTQVRNIQIQFKLRPGENSYGDAGSGTNPNPLLPPDEGVAVINFWNINKEYLVAGTADQWHRFNLQHIFNHEIVHALTGEPDGSWHAFLVDQINADTDGGPPRAGYDDVRLSDTPLFEFCFGAEVLISMWPLDPELAPDPDNPYKQYDQEAVRAKVWNKPIDLIRVGDIVVSFDNNNNLVPGSVNQIFENEAKILLNFFGTRVTPGHAYYRADSKKAYKFETLIDILRDDGVVAHQDGTLIRAATDVPVGDPRDGFVQAITGTRKADGSVDLKDQGRIRLGTRFLVGEGKSRKSYAVADLIEAGGGIVGEDELIRVGDGLPIPFHWEFGETLPKPEDFVLACSGTTLEDIYKAAEWESQGPRLPAPMVMDGGAVQPLSNAAKRNMPRNEPPFLSHKIRV